MTLNKKIHYRIKTYSRRKAIADQLTEEIRKAILRWGVIFDWTDPTSNIVTLIGKETYERRFDKDSKIHKLDFNE